MIYNPKDNNILAIGDVLDRTYSGWLEGINDEGIVIPLCYSTRVKHIEEVRNAQKILIIEGLHKGKIVIISYKYKDRGAKMSFLTPQIVFHKATLKLNKMKKELVIPKVGTFSVADTRSIQYGKYKLQIPERPITKPLNPEYFDENIGGSRFSQTWFRLIPEKGNPGEVFLHYGSYSEGCITVLNNKSFSVWNKIYLYLIKGRVSDVHLATLVVN